MNLNLHGKGLIRCQIWPAELSIADFGTLSPMLKIRLNSIHGSKVIWFKKSKIFAFTKFADDSSET